MTNFKKFQTSAWDAFHALESAEESGDNEKIAEANDALSEICDKIREIQRAAVFKTACRCVKNRGRNQFTVASEWADEAVKELDWTDDAFEIPSWCTKAGNVELVRFR